MLGRSLLALMFVATAFAGCINAPDTVESASVDPTSGFGDDVVVIAVVDGGINPYHLDWQAATYPLNMDDDVTNDVAFDASPDTYVTGLTTPSGGLHALPLSVGGDASEKIADLLKADADIIKSISKSTADAVHMYYVPGTKIIGIVDFAGSGAITNSGAHGARTASVSTGNVYGSCPNCLLVFINNGGGEDAYDWAVSQPWIDVVTNSYGYSLVMRDRLYSGSDIPLSRMASEQGKTIFFSAGNGQANTFTVPNPTLFSSQEGPDWMVTVGAISPNTRASYTGHGKPADIASIGNSYPSQGGDDVSGEGTFGGTSSATPTIAGMYASALAWARETLPGPSRIQEDGVIARGDAVPCGEARPDCELGDGILTAVELRTRLFEGAIHTPMGLTVQDRVTAPAIGEEEFLNEGHGTYFARMDGADAWAEELARITGPMDGSAAALERPAGEREWMIVDSWCRQNIWEPWALGYYVAGETTLPGADPMWPMRTAILASCEQLFPPVKAL